LAATWRKDSPPPPAYARQHLNTHALAYCCRTRARSTCVTLRAGAGAALQPHFCALLCLQPQQLIFYCGRTRRTRADHDDWHAHGLPALVPAALPSHSGHHMRALHSHYHPLLQNTSYRSHRHSPTCRASVCDYRNAPTPRVNCVARHRAGATLHRL